MSFVIGQTLGLQQHLPSSANWKPKEFFFTPVFNIDGSGLVLNFVSVGGDNQRLIYDLGVHTTPAGVVATSRFDVEVDVDYILVTEFYEPTMDEKILVRSYLYIVGNSEWLRFSNNNHQHDWNSLGNSFPTEWFEGPFAKLTYLGVNNDTPKTIQLAHVHKHFFTICQEGLVLEEYEIGNIEVKSTGAAIIVYRKTDGENSYIIARWLDGEWKLNNDAKLLWSLEVED